MNVPFLTDSDRLALRLPGLCALCMLASVLTILSGCNGRVGEPGAAVSEPEPVVPDDPPTAGRPAFDSSRESVTLLPFDVRLQRVADAVGVDVTDPILNDLREAKLELGGHDYAAGIPPDLTWSARRLTGWARALKPVCESGAMRARYPNLRDSLTEFTLNAYGRRTTPADFEAFDASLSEAGAGLSEEATYRAMCIALFSSTELVAR